MNDSGVVPGSIVVTLKTCGRPEAAWQPESRELVVCYELFDAYAKIHELKQTTESTN